MVFGLSLPIIALKTEQDFNNRLVLEPRWDLVAWFVAHHLRRAFRSPRSCLPRRGNGAMAARIADRFHTRRAHRLRLGRPRLPARLPVAVPGPHRRLRRRQMDRQFRHPDPDLRDARLGPQHRRRPRRSSRSRLRRLLRRRRLLLCPARQDLRPVVLAVPAARRHPRRLLGHPARLSRAAPARRLSRHRHARLRRDHPPRADQLGRPDGGYAGISGIPRPTFFGLPFNASDEGFAATLRHRVLAAAPHDLPLLPHPGARTI